MPNIINCLFPNGKRRVASLGGSYLLSFLFLFFYASIISQNEGKKWFFGSNAGLDFTTNPPTPTLGQINVWEGCSVISDASGNLLFYTDGGSIYNQTQIMANGAGLYGGGTSTQAALIAKQPGNADIYYVFTQEGMGGINGSSYSIVDMSLASGNGSVTLKNVSLHTPSTEKVAGVKHCNGEDVWIITHDLFTDTFRTYLITSTGLNINPIFSSIGTQNGTANNPDYAGHIKISPNGRKLGVTYQNQHTVEIFDFNNSNGTVTNSLSLALPGSFYNAYGCEFSPDGTKFYAGGINSEDIYQWNLCAGSDSAILASKISIGSVDANKGAFQLAPDGKIYVAKLFEKTLGVINNPNALGIACNYIDQGQTLGTQTSNYGLPNFISSYFKPTISFHDSISYTYNPTQYCSRVIFDTPGLGLMNCSASENFLSNNIWRFGDPASGNANISTLINPIHNYYNAGTYTVQLILNYGCRQDTLYKAISIIGPSPDINLTGKSVICTGETTTILATGADTYSWSTNVSTNSISISPLYQTSYSVVGTNSLNNCSSITNFTIFVSVCENVMKIAPEKSIELFPNPVGDYIRVIDTEFSNHSIIFSIRNSSGQNLAEGNLFSGESIDVSALQDGVYIIQVKCDNRIFREKFFKINQ